MLLAITVALASPSGLVMVHYVQIVYYVKWPCNNNTHCNNNTVVVLSSLNGTQTKLNTTTLQQSYFFKGMATFFDSYCTCIRTHTHSTYRHTCTYTYTHMYTHTDTHMYMYTHTHTTHIYTQSYFPVIHPHTSVRTCTCHVYNQGERCTAQNHTRAFTAFVLGIDN